MDQWIAASELGPAFSEPVVWKPGELEFELQTFVTDEMPPDALITSVRCVVLQGDSVLLLTDADGRGHIVPGGRREADESLNDTLRRELREETNLELGSLRLIGFQWYHHLMPKPEGYGYPYPDFVQVVFAAEATTDQQVICDDEWVVSAQFVPVDIAVDCVSAGQHALCFRAADVITSSSSGPDD